ncbi:MAG: 5-bromo-4-chloroindolyl phosphate hydrolysis family protein [Dysosmobacter welbionis]
MDRLETITAKIFRAVEEDPKKRDRIDTFLNYYLPTTQKLLDSYAEFEAAGVEGEPPPGQSPDRVHHGPDYQGL